MQEHEFIAKVRERAGIEDNDQAKMATEVVLETLRARISHAGGDNVAAQFPKELRELWESGPLEHLQRSIIGFERLDLGAFLARVAQRMNYQDITQAESTTRAVFWAIKEQITPGADQAIMHQLPPDIRQFWEQSGPAIRTEAGERGAEEGEILSGLEMQAEGPPYEFEAPVVPTEEEEVGARPWGPETDIPSGADVDVTISQLEALAKEEGIHEERVEAERISGIAETGQAEYVEGEVEPPAMNRMNIVSPPGEFAEASGPGSTSHYRSDPQLEIEIRDMLEESDEVDSTNIDVFVQAGNVTLRGAVGSEHERDAAGRIAAKGLGVGEIWNEITVEEMGPGAS